jgi:putative spermidine/putrescine transport system substrate-binding protein
MSTSSRRHFVVLAGSLLAAACSPAPAAPPAKPVEAKPTEAPKPSAPAAAPAASPAAAPSPAASPAPSPAAAKPAGAITPGQFAGKTLNVALAPGRIDDLNKHFVPDFEKLSGAKVQATGARSADQVARARIEKDKPTLDLLWIDIGEAELLGREGVVAKVSDTDLPNLRDIRDNAKSAIGIAPVAFSSALGFLYNKDLVKDPPKSWADLWDPRFKNTIAMFDMGSTIGALMLIIAARLSGGNENTIDPGFKKLAELKTNVVGFKASGPDNNNLVAQGEAGITFALANQTLDLKAKGANVDWLIPSDGCATLPQGYQVVEKAPEPALARAFANYMLGLEAQNKLANDLLLAATNKNVQLDAKNAPLVPLDKLIYFDWTAIGAKRGEWTNRFNREILGG